MIDAQAMYIKEYMCVSNDAWWRQKNILLYCWEKWTIDNFHKLQKHSFSAEIIVTEYVKLFANYYC
jgi:hypothetical protein